MKTDIHAEAIATPAAEAAEGSNVLISRTKPTDNNDWKDDIIIYPVNPSDAGVASIITYLQGIPANAPNTGMMWASTIQVTGAGFTAFFFVPNVNPCQLQDLKTALQGSVRQMPPLSDVPVVAFQALLGFFSCLFSIVLYSLT